MRAAGIDPVLADGASVGRYVIERPLGAGAMGVVYAAYDPALGRRVAIKVLNTEDRRQARADRLLRLTREAWAMARLGHPNVVAIFDVGAHGEDVFIAMELIEGQTLRQWLSAAPRSRAEILDVFMQAGRGLAAAHAAGLVHRDFKPDNVLVDRAGRARVTDFGLARQMEPEELAARTVEATPGWQDRFSCIRTAASLVVGTPAYMAAEQFAGAALDQRTDEFSFCAALYEALYGERAFAGERLEDLALAVSTGRVRPAPAASRVPPWLRRVLLRGLSPRPGDRFASFELLLAALAADPVPVRRRRILQGASATLLIGAIAVGALSWWHSRALLCSGAREQLATVWNDARRDALYAAGRTGGRDTSPAWQRAAGLVEAYASEWERMYRQSCEATRVRREQTEHVMALRGRCLERRRAELGSVLDLLTGGGERVFEVAVPVTEALTPIAVCAEPDALEVAFALPKDPAARAEVADAEAALGKAKVQRDAGWYGNGLEMARPLANRARALGYPPLLGEALFLLGDLEGRAGDARQAERILYEALHCADKARLDLLRAQVWVELVWYVGYRLARYDEAHRIADHAEAAVERLGPGQAALRARLLSFRGLVLGAQGRLLEARTTHEQALELRRRVLPAGHRDIASSANNLGLVAWQQGDLASALELEREAYDIRVAALGPEHLEVATSHNNIGGVLADSGLHQEALEQYAAALEIRQRHLGREHPLVASVHNNMAYSLLQVGRQEEALAVARRAVAIEDRIEPGHTKASIYRLTLADALLAAGDVEGAERVAGGALAALTKKDESKHPEAGTAYRILAACARLRGEPALAVDRCERALAIQQATLHPWHPSLLRTQLELGLSLLAQGQPTKAVAPLDSAHRMLKEHSRDPVLRSDVALALARALASRGDRGAARRLVTEAQASLAAAAWDVTGRRQAIADWLRAHSEP